MAMPDVDGWLDRYGLGMKTQKEQIEEIAVYKILMEEDVVQEILRNKKTTVMVALRGHLPYNWPDRYPDHDPVVAMVKVGEKPAEPLVAESMLHDGSIRLLYFPGAIPRSGREWDRNWMLDGMILLVRRVRLEGGDLRGDFRFVLQTP